ncbi:MAG: hypothetical protein MNPFHGCM_02444 [Gemmatimonadaceae bacterium]|nr:hypothetical protein [Gemmatimonadaceae bacterium]
MIRIAVDGTGATSGVIALLGNDRRCFQYGHPALPWMAHDCGTLIRCGLLSLTVENGGVLSIGDAHEFSHDEDVRRAAAALGVGSLTSIVMPRSDGTVLGMLCVFADAPRDWTEVRMRTLHDVAEMASTEVHLRRALAERESRERQLQHDSLHDGLTGLPNRSLFMRRLSDAAQRVKRGDDSLFAVLFLDLDDFKQVNDKYGHRGGDEILIETARRLGDCIRGGDLVARLGGDEFAILLERVSDARDGAMVADRVQAALREPFVVGSCSHVATASIGVVLSSSGTFQPDQLLRNADMAMYRAKSAGRARFEMFDRAMHADALARLQLEQDLQRALDADEFELYYQPIVSLATGRIAGVEALVRWCRQDDGVASPGDFIPVAEETGLIVPLGRWVLSEACRQVRAWQLAIGQAQSITLAVNLSVREFSEPELVSQVSTILADTGMEASALRLEITESAIIGQGHPALQTIADLRALGVQIHLDDFGTGYSALSYLHRLPLDAVKVDRGTISIIDREERPLKVVQSIIGLVRALGMGVVAEGIATPAQLDLLRAMGCDLGQGYLFSPPCSAAAMGRLLSSGQTW